MNEFDAGEIGDIKIVDSSKIDIVAEILKNAEKNKELRLQEENQRKIMKQREEEVRNKTLDYVMNNVLGRFRDVLPVKNVDSQNRLIKFAHECLDENAPLSQGYYFENEENVDQFIKEVLFAYYVGNTRCFFSSWTVIDSVKLVDQWMTNKWMDDKFTVSSVTQYDLFFIVNSYNRYFPSKRHKLLYRLAGLVISDRDREIFRKRKRDRTFILSLTHDVGPDKGPEHGFGIPMFSIKEKIQEVLANKENGKKYLW